MRTSEQISEVAKAISSLQGNMKPAHKDSSNPHFKAKFASIAAIWEAIRDLLLVNGLCVLQDAISSENGISIVTRVIHNSGQWIEFGPFEIPLTKKDAQGLGSACSYGKRYALSAALGIVSSDEDDDGNAATTKADVKPVQYINSSQIEQLNKLLEQNEEINEWFFARLKAGGTKSIAEINAQSFGSIVDVLTRKLKEAQLVRQAVEAMDGS